jgi:hypothetical protein
VLPDQLQELYLPNNYLPGPIPSGWRLGAELRQLILMNCSLVGTASSEWLRTGSSIQYLLLQQNSLSGSLPSYLPPKIISINLSSNRFTGTIPAAFTGLQSLQVMNLAYNQLTGMCVLQARANAFLKHSVSWSCSQPGQDQCIQTSQYQLSFCNQRTGTFVPAVGIRVTSAMLGCRIHPFRILLQCLIADLWSDVKQQQLKW